MRPLPEPLPVNKRGVRRSLCCWTERVTVGEDVRLVFVTSEIFNGSMTDPDALCVKAAMDAWPEGPNDLKAWATVNKIPPAIKG